MKKILKIIGLLITVTILATVLYCFAKNESLPSGTPGKEAEELAEKMMSAINKRAFDHTEILEWSFKGKHHYVWKKQQGLVDVSWDSISVTVNLNDYSKSIGTSSELIETAINFFNNDSFWLIAPYKVFDDGVERSIVKVNNKDALLIKYTSGGTTPGDSYLWILDENYVPVSFKMWTQIIPIGGVSATWNDFITSGSGIKLPTSHTLSLFGIKIDMGEVKAYNPNADKLAHNMLKAIKHEAYKNTGYIDWSFKGKRFYKWDKIQHIVEVKWNDAKVLLHPNDLTKSTVYLNDKEVSYNDNLVKRALRFFNNDSFWLVAPHKLFEPGIYRSIRIVDGKEALHVKYSKGGTTPGDSYTWLLDKNYMPTHYQMYVQAMKKKGTTVTWENWIQTTSGTLLPKNHRYLSGKEINMGLVKGYN
ncbi:hypothetical protein OAV61_04205 [Flavobacteriaceae bacterium]|jgi:hypothetical protein|nr:hypothetical protein [Flavobacteriaceae bacterium]MDC3285566.1 hypothetical protein [Flavobacteriaceae bacterium]MDC3318941.1 hypothetical protein [Flavobacteriaceae bacterium]